MIHPLTPHPKRRLLVCFLKHCFNADQDVNFQFNNVHYICRSCRLFPYLKSVTCIYLLVSRMIIEMITGMDFIYRREAGFYPWKICETSPSYSPRLSFEDLQGSLWFLFVLDSSGNKSSNFQPSSSGYEVEIDPMYMYILSVF